jgi:hypothetical protein
MITVAMRHSVRRTWAPLQDNAILTIAGTLTPAVIMLPIRQKLMHVLERGVLGPWLTPF